MALRDVHGNISVRDAMRLEIIPPPLEFTLLLKGHWPIGIPDGDGYVRVTSPLRRYSDMVAHWQIKYALLKEKLPFSVEWLEEFIKFSTVRSKLQKREKHRHKLFWALVFIKRWMEDPFRNEREVDPLQSLTAVPFNLPRLHFTAKDFVCGVHIPILGIDGFLHLRHKDEVKMGDVINVKISKIILGNEPNMRLVKR
jgi:exoribonuclease II